MDRDWTCICCTYDKNPDADDECFICGTARQTPGTPHQSQMQGTAHQSQLQGTVRQSQLQSTVYQSQLQGKAHQSQLQGTAHHSQLQGTVHQSQLQGKAHQSQLQGTAHQSQLQGTAHQSKLQGTAHQSLDSSHHSWGTFFKRHGQGKPAFKPDENELPSLTVRWGAFKMGSPEGITDTDSKSKSPNPALYKTRTFRRGSFCQMTPGIVDSK
ncbi:uncharacterized protein LOC121388511 [Gigantopelta aegis]|uniref:uncharacterized protein LOC121388511 n=1 Tax=Gigantopelta aegis TaxID=1735272 RepID=UPI001B888A27|nr:uncharacterized protein LOC121388511 [Gigantopelta aegis]